MLEAMALIAMQAAVPAPGSIELDLRCLILTGQLRGAQDHQVRQAAEAASYFFFGRVDSRVPDAEMEERIWRESRQLTDDNRTATFEACGNLMQARGGRLVEVGRRLETREAAPEPGQ